MFSTTNKGKIATKDLNWGLSQTQKRLTKSVTIHPNNRSGVDPTKPFLR